MKTFGQNVQKWKERINRMLFGTYQQMWDISKGIPANFMNPERYYYDDLGFAPIWAFPMDGFKELVAHSLCTAPNYPDIFYIIETEKYLRIDKVEHYRRIKTGEYRELSRRDYELSSLIDESVDNDHSEILLNPGEIGVENIRCICPIGDTKKDPYSQLKHIFPPVFMDGSRELNEIADTIGFIATGIPRIDGGAVSEQLVRLGFSERYSKLGGIRRELKYNFEITVLPYLYMAYVRRRELKSYELFSLSHNAKKLIAAEDEFTRWSYGECERKEYDGIFEHIKQLVITDDNVLKSLVGKKKIYPNDPCPCGSGLKFKHCHGRN